MLKPSYKVGMIVFNFQGVGRKLRGEDSWPRLHSKGRGCKLISARFKASGPTHGTALLLEGWGMVLEMTRRLTLVRLAKAGAQRRVSPDPGNILKARLPGPHSPARAREDCLSKGRHQAERRKEIRQISLTRGRNAYKWDFSLVKATGKKCGQLSDETLDRKGTGKAERVGPACLSQWNLNAGKRFYSNLLRQWGRYFYYTHFSDDDAIAEVKALD